MPRLPNSLLRHARHINPLLSLLLRTCRDLSSARNELRWLREHVLTTTKARSPPRPRQHLHQLCVQRSRGKPLQYILGNQPFGDLDIICKRGVLIPRPETEAYTTHLAHLLINKNKRIDSVDGLLKWPQLRILDLCTGTGCIPLLLHAILAAKLSDTQLLGIDISRQALALANQNLRWNIAQAHLRQVAREQVRFVQGDIFHDIPILSGTWDIVVSNPPYISPRSFNTDTSRSVRIFEPKSALVPPCAYTRSDVEGGPLEQDLAIGDTFYPRLLEIAANVDAKVLLMEVADMKQAKRVVDLAVKDGRWDGYEIWRDYPDQGVASERDALEIQGQRVKISGEGHGRSVFLSRAGGVNISGLG